MKKEIELIKYVRTNILKMIAPLTTEQLNHTPIKFNNNIIWNMAHLIITQQAMCYRQGGLDMQIDGNYFSAYIPGTKPEKYIDEIEIAHIKDLFLTTIDLSDIDKFNTYKPWALPTGIEINTINDALNLTAVHEGRHYGAITALLKLVV